MNKKVKCGSLKSNLVKDVEKTASVVTAGEVPLSSARKNLFSDIENTSPSLRNEGMSDVNDKSGGTTINGVTQSVDKLSQLSTMDKLNQLSGKESRPQNFQALKDKTSSLQNISKNGSKSSHRGSEEKSANASKNGSKSSHRGSEEKSENVSQNGSKSSHCVSEDQYENISRNGSNSNHQKSEVSAVNSTSNRIVNDEVSLFESPNPPDTRKDSGKKPQEILGAKEKALTLARQMDEIDYKAYVILSLTEMRQQLKEVTSKVLAISLSKTSSSATSTAAMSEADLATFMKDQEKQHHLSAPALDLQTWLDFNSDLERDKKFAFAVVKQLKHECSSPDLPSFVRSALSTVISNALASQYSWAGKKGKHAFSKLYFVRVLDWMLKNECQFKRHKNDLKNVAKDWLRLASQRLGGKNFECYKIRKVQSNGTSNQSGDMISPSKGASGKKRKLPSPFKSPGKRMFARIASSTPVQPSRKGNFKKNVITSSDEEFNPVGTELDAPNDSLIFNGAEEIEYEKDEADASFEDLDAGW